MKANTFLRTFIARSPHGNSSTASGYSRAACRSRSSALRWAALAGPRSSRMVGRYANSVFVGFASYSLPLDNAAGARHGAALRRHIHNSVTPRLRRLRLLLATARQCRRRSARRRTAAPHPQLCDTPVFVGFASYSLPLDNAAGARHGAALRRHIDNSVTPLLY